MKSGQNPVEQSTPKGGCETGCGAQLKSSEVSSVAGESLKGKGERKDGESEPHHSRKCHSKPVTVLLRKAQYAAYNCLHVCL